MENGATLESVKNRLFDRLPMLEVLDHDSLQQRGSNLGVPGSFWIDDNNRPVAADAEAGRFTALDALRAEEQILALQKAGEQRIDLAPTAVRRAKAARTHEHVTRVGLHLRLHRVTHGPKIHMATGSSTCTTASSP